MKSSFLHNKSEILQEALTTLQDKEYFPIVGHSAYYCCVQLMKHIWLYISQKTEDDLKTERQNQKKGTHEILIKNTEQFLQKANLKDFQTFNKNIWQLRALRIKADYDDVDFLYNDSKDSITLSNELYPILKKY